MHFYAQTEQKGFSRLLIPKFTRRSNAHAAKPGRSSRIVEKRMRTVISILMFFLSFPVCVFSAQTGSIAPVFILGDTQGRHVSLDDFKGKVIFLDFWAPWCVPCKEELPELEMLYSKYRREGLEVVAVAVGSSEKTVSKFLRKISVSYTVLLDDKEEAAEKYGCSHMPTGYLIGRDGVIHYIHKGFGKEFLPVYEKEIVELLKLH